MIPAWAWWLVAAIVVLYLVVWILSEMDVFDIDVPFFFHFGGSGASRSRPVKQSQLRRRNDGSYWPDGPDDFMDDD